MCCIKRELINETRSTNTPFLFTFEGLISGVTDIMSQQTDGQRLVHLHNIKNEELRVREVHCKSKWNIKKVHRPDYLTLVQMSGLLGLNPKLELFYSSGQPFAIVLGPASTPPSSARNIIPIFSSHATCNILYMLNEP